LSSIDLVSLENNKSKLMTKGKGLLAVLGIAGIFAWWKYKNMTPEEKAKLKDQLDSAGQKIKETAKNVEETISEKYEELKDTIESKVDDARS